MPRQNTGICAPDLMAKYRGHELERDAKLDELRRNRAAQIVACRGDASHHHRVAVHVSYQYGRGPLGRRLGARP